MEWRIPNFDSRAMSAYELQSKSKLPVSTLVAPLILLCRIPYRPHLWSSDYSSSCDLWHICAFEYFWHPHYDEFIYFFFRQSLQKL